MNEKGVISVPASQMGKPRAKTSRLTQRTSLQQRADLGTVPVVSLENPEAARAML